MSSVKRKCKRPTGPRIKRLKDGSEAESTIQARILRWLETTGLLHWRQNSGDLFRYGRRITLGPEGIPDIVVVIPPGGTFLGLEVKSAKGVLKKGQKAFRERLTAAGGMYTVVRSLTEARASVSMALKRGVT